jgi:dTDP-4-amino-4,6-dideoxygalactose transaminase
MNVPLLDLGPQIQTLRNEIIQAVTKVIDSTQYILGPEVSSFERDVAAYCQADFGIGVSSGTDALVMTMMAMGIGPGDKVLTTPYTFFATMGAVLRVGAKPVFVDINQESFNMDPVALEDMLWQERNENSRIRAILPIHLFGQCADMDRILQLARKYEVPVVEDAAQAIGACCPVTDDQGNIDWKKAGSMGLTGCFSFFPSKNLGGIGDGGLVTTNDEEFVEILRSCRNHGAAPKYYHSRVGGNFRLDPVQAVVLTIKLRHLEKWHDRRRANSLVYRKLFMDKGLLHSPVELPVESFADVPGAEEHSHHIYNQFIIRVPDRDALRTYLHAHSIGCEIYYPLCLHQQECVKEFNDQVFPVAEKAARETLALPIYPELTEEQISFVVDTIASFYTSI